MLKSYAHIPYRKWWPVKDLGTKDNEIGFIFDNFLDESGTGTVYDGSLASILFIYRDFPYREPISLSARIPY
jgi:hypothetical protein